MSDEPNSKRRKMFHKKPGFQQQARNFIEPGIKGFLATCNFREKDCVRECYNLLNEYADKSTEELASSAHGDIAVVEDSGGAAKVAEDDLMKPDVSSTKDFDGDDEEEEEDISAQLAKEIESTKTASKVSQNRFQQCETKVPNCIFIKTTIDNPNELGVRIVRDIAATKKRKTRMLLRLLPVDIICKANVEDIKNQAGKLFDKYFLTTDPTTFSIVVNKRYNNNFDRMEIIRELADLITYKNSLHKVNLKEAKLTVMIEVIKGLCCISVLPDYNELKKFNLSELAQAKDAVDDGAKDSVESTSETKTVEPDSAADSQPKEG